MYVLISSINYALKPRTVEQNLLTITPPAQIKPPTPLDC